LSWATSKTAIELVLSTLSYFEIPENKNLKDAQKHDHKTYTLKWVDGYDIRMHTNNNVSFVNVVELQVSYINMMATNRDANVVLWQALVSNIAKINGFNGFASTFPLDDIDNKNTVGTFRFYIGAEGLC
jgi:hypothetical protein